MITCIENSINKKGEICSVFIIEPLNLGHAITIGTSLRRIILSEISGFSVHSVRIHGIKHEYMDIEYLRESTYELLLNLRKINFKDLTNSINSKIQGRLFVEGPQIVTARSILDLPKNLIIINPSQYICSITTSKTLIIELFIEKHYGYKTVKEDLDLKMLEQTKLSEYPIISIDNIYNPIIRINSKIFLIHDKNGAIKESLILEIFTNGGITPFKALKKGIQNLLDMFYSLNVFTKF